MIDRQVNADVILYSNNVTMGHGMEEVINVGVNQNGEGLQRFPVPMLAADETFAGVRLIETYVARSNACNTSCGSCDPLDFSGGFHVAYATSQWNEMYACYDFRDNAVLWQAGGATGQMDRSSVVGNASYTASTDLVFDLDITELATWIQSSQLSVILTGDDANGEIVIAQKDYGAACSPPPEPVHVQFTACH